MSSGLKDSWKNVERLGFRFIEESSGATAAVIDTPGDFFIAQNVEGLGTKNMIPEDMAAQIDDMVEAGMVEWLEGQKRELFAGLGQCEMAMSLNDLCGVGAVPLSFMSIIATGDSAYMDDEKRNQGLLDGYERGQILQVWLSLVGRPPRLRG